MLKTSIIDITPENILEYGVCRYKDLKNKGFADKVDWFNQYYKYGLKIKCILTEKDGVQGMIEYIPGEYAWRPVNAKGYMFIHCIFSNYKSIYKNNGFGNMLINACIEEAKAGNKFGVAVVTRKSSFMAGNAIFVKRGFEICDTAKPDFHLLALKFATDAYTPKFNESVNFKSVQPEPELQIVRSAQCPYTRNNVDEIIETAKNDFGLNAQIIENTDHVKAQNSPCAFGSFCIIYKGEIISYHPVSNTRFRNIMNSIVASE